MAHTSLVALDHTFNADRIIRRYGSKPFRAQFLKMGDRITTFDCSMIDSLSTPVPAWIGSGPGFPSDDWEWYIMTDPSGMYVHLKIETPELHVIYDKSTILPSFDSNKIGIKWENFRDSYNPDPDLRLIQRLTFKRPVIITRWSSGITLLWPTHTPITVMNMKQAVLWKFGEFDLPIWVGDGTTATPDESWDWYVKWENCRISVHMKSVRTENVQLFDPHPIDVPHDPNRGFWWSLKSMKVLFEEPRFIGSMSGNTMWLGIRAGSKKLYNMINFDTVDITNKFYFVRGGVCLTEPGWAASWALWPTEEEWLEVRAQWKKDGFIEHPITSVRLDNDVGQNYIDSILEEIYIERGSVVRTVRDNTGNIVHGWYDVVDEYLNYHFDKIYAYEDSNGNTIIIQKDPDGNEYLKEAKLDELNQEYLNGNNKTWGDRLRGIQVEIVRRYTSPITQLIWPPPGRYTPNVYSPFQHFYNETNLYRPRSAEDLAKGIGLDYIFTETNPADQSIYESYDRMITPTPDDLTNKTDPDWFNMDTETWPHYALDGSGRLIEMSRTKYDAMINDWLKEITERTYKENNFLNIRPQNPKPDDPVITAQWQEDAAAWDTEKSRLDSLIYEELNERKTKYDSTHIRSKYLARIQNYLDYRQQFIRIEGSLMTWPPKDDLILIGDNKPPEKDVVTKFDSDYHRVVKWWIGFYLKWARIDEGWVTYPDSYVLSEKYANPPLVGRTSGPSDPLKKGWFDLRDRADEYGFSLNDEETGMFSYCQDKVDAMFETIMAENVLFDGGAIETVDSTQEEEPSPFVYIELRVKCRTYDEDKKQYVSVPPWGTGFRPPVQFTYKGKEKSPPGHEEGRIALPSQLKFQAGDYVSKILPDGKVESELKEYGTVMGTPPNTYLFGFTDGVDPRDIEVGIIFGGKVKDALITGVKSFARSSYNDTAQTWGVETPISFTLNSGRAQFKINLNRSYVIDAQVDWLGEVEKGQGASNGLWDIKSGMLPGYAESYLKMFEQLEEANWFQMAKDDDKRKTCFDKCILPNIFTPFDQLPFSLKSTFFSPGSETFIDSMFLPDNPFFQPGYGVGEDGGFMCHTFHWPYWNKTTFTGINGVDFASPFTKSLMTVPNTFKVTGVTSNRVQSPQGNDRTIPNHPRNLWSSSIPNPEEIIVKFNYIINNPFFSGVTPPAITDVIGRVMALQTYDFILINSRKATRDQLTHDYPYQNYPNLTQFPWEWKFEAKDDKLDINGDPIGRGDFVGRRPISYTFVLHPIGSPVLNEGNAIDRIVTLQDLWNEYRQRYELYAGPRLGTNAYRGFTVHTNQLGIGPDAQKPEVLDANDGIIKRYGGFRDYYFQDLRTAPLWPGYQPGKNPQRRGREVLEPLSPMWFPENTLLEDRGDRWERDAAQKVEFLLNKGQHAVMTVHCEEVDHLVLRGILGYEASGGIRLNDWIPFTGKTAVEEEEGMTP